MELHILAAKPMSSPVIPSITPSPANPTTLPKESCRHTMILYINKATKADKPVLTRAGTALSPKNGAMYTNDAIRTRISKKYSKFAIEKEKLIIYHPIPCLYKN